jgi:hypothetical protein
MKIFFFDELYLEDMNNKKYVRGAFSYQIKTIISNSGIKDINFNKRNYKIRGVE